MSPQTPDTTQTPHTTRTPHTSNGGTATAIRAVSLLGVGCAAPALRLPVSEIAAAWGGGGGRATVAVCDTDEDTLTLAWRAATSAIGASGVDPGLLSGLWWGTARPPFAEGPSHAFLAATLGLDASAGGALFAGSPHSGIEALFGAWDAIASGHCTHALVVASDALVPGLGTSTETVTGAGAAALVLGADFAQASARLVARCTRSLPAVDRYRADGQGATGDVYDPRLFREELYLPLLGEVGTRLVASDGAQGPPVSWAVSDPDGKLASSLARRLSAPLSSARVQGALGDTAAAASLLGLIGACAESAPESVNSAKKSVAAIAYGGGRASAVSLELSGAVPGASAIEQCLDGGTTIGYTRALRSRGQLEPMAEPIQMGLPPGGAAFARGNHEMLLLEGARCKGCGTISTPPSVHPACTGCGGSALETVKLARSGTVVTFVVNQTMPPPFAAPLPLVVVDLEDGARLMLQGTPEDADSLAVGDTVNLMLRRYALERGIPVYGYKVSRTAGAGSPVVVSSKLTEEVGP